MDEKEVGVNAVPTAQTTSSFGSSHLIQYDFPMVLSLSTDDASKRLITLKGAEEPFSA